jgi:hypothetical protein
VAGVVLRSSVLQSRIVPYIDEVLQPALEFGMRHLDRIGPRHCLSRPPTLGPKDKYLALTKAHYDNIRANITYSRLDSRGPGRVQLAAELPLLYTAGRWPTAPEVNYPAPVDELANQPRRTSQSELEAEPFLQSISAYRYVHS